LSARAELQRADGRRVAVLGLDDVVAQHLVRAVAEHARWCRTNGILLPSVLADLLAALACDGQERPPVAPPVFEPDDGAVLLFDYHAAGRRLGVSERTVRRLAAAGKLAVVNVEGCRRIRATDLADYVKGL
jgi:excisionase family DNA binding protein